MTSRGRHSSVPLGLGPAIAWLDAQAGVKRVIFGPCKGGRHTRPTGTLKVKRELPGRLVLAAYAGGVVMEVAVVADDLTALKARIEAR